MTLREQKDFMAEAVANGSTIEAAGKRIGLGRFDAQRVWRAIEREIGGDREFYVVD